MLSLECTEAHRVPHQMVPNFIPLSMLATLELKR